MKNAMQLKAIMKKLAKENQISAQLVLQNYMLERFLERVSLSPYRDNYIIKGGFYPLWWGESTMDNYINYQLTITSR